MPGQTSHASWMWPTVFRHFNPKYHANKSLSILRCGHTEKIFVAAAGVGLFFLALLAWGYKGAETLLLPASSNQGFSLADLKIVEGAEARGAVCLDGSPPGYYFQPGYGSGAQSWLVFLQGGGWCTEERLCAKRADTPLGSSRAMQKTMVYEGILSNSSEFNPDFYNWNRVMVAYCDGASFAGDVEELINYQGRDIYFRGQRIWRAVMDELLASGMASATQALLAGCSAGGLATMLHCDQFQGLLPRANVKCMSDGGFFLDEKDIAGRHTIREFYQSVFNMQGLRKTLDGTCIDAHDHVEQWQCFFPQHIVRYIQTPLFVINAFYDNWQINNILVPHSADPWGKWSFCQQDPIRCTDSQLSTLNEFRASMLDRLKPLTNSEEGGVFLLSCFIHCQTIFSTTWHGPSVPRINNKTMAEALGDWFFDRRSVREIDEPYPSNPTCFDWRHPDT